MLTTSTQPVVILATAKQMAMVLGEANDTRGWNKTLDDGQSFFVQTPLFFTHENDAVGMYEIIANEQSVLQQAAFNIHKQIL